MALALSATKQWGFTLLELITVLAIISILTLISYPVYTQYVLKTNRAQAETALLDVALGLERYYALHNTYAGATLMDVQVNDFTANAAYRLAINSASEESYVLTATPLGGGQLADQMCGVLSLNSLGEKGISGAGKVVDCW